MLRKLKQRISTYHLKTPGRGKGMSCGPTPQFRWVQYFNTLANIPCLRNKSARCGEDVALCGAPGHRSRRFPITITKASFLICGKVFEEVCYDS